MPLKLQIITPEKVVLESEDVQQLVLPAANGEVGILPGHIPMVCSLGAGTILVERASETVSLATTGGFARVASDRIVVLAHTAEPAEGKAAGGAAQMEKEPLDKSAEADQATVVSALARARARDEDGAEEG